MSETPIPVLVARTVAAAVLLCATAPALAQDDQQRVAVVDLDRVILLSPIGKSMQQELKTLQEQTATRLQGHASKAQEIRVKATEQSLGEDELRSLQQQLEDENIAGRRVRDDAERQAKKIQEDALKKIQEQLAPVFKKLLDEGGYDVILNNASGVVVMASPTADLTAQVLQFLDSPASGE